MLFAIVIPSHDVHDGDRRFAIHYEGVGDVGSFVAKDVEGADAQTGTFHVDAGGDSPGEFARVLEVGDHHAIPSGAVVERELDGDGALSHVVIRSTPANLADFAATGRGNVGSFEVGELNHGFDAVHQAPDVGASGGVGDDLAVAHAVGTNEFEAVAAATFGFKAEGRLKVFVFAVEVPILSPSI